MPHRRRPRRYCPKIADAIVEDLWRGIPLERACAGGERPFDRTFRDWMRAYPDLAARVAAARARHRRPKALTPELWELISDALFRGVPIVVFCAAPPFPTEKMFYAWKKADPVFRGNVDGLMAHRPRPFHDRGGLVSFTPERADEVIRRLMRGEGLKAIGRDPAMPSVSCIKKWARLIPVFGENFRIAMKRPRPAPAPWPGYWSEELGKRICRRIAHNESLKAICAEPDMPGLSTVGDWLRARPAFRAAYREAREHAAWLRADAKLGAWNAANPALASEWAREMAQAMGLEPPRG